MLGLWALPGLIVERRPPANVRTCFSPHPATGARPSCRTSASPKRRHARTRPAITFHSVTARQRLVNDGNLEGTTPAWWRPTGYFMQFGPILAQAHTSFGTRPSGLNKSRPQRTRNDNGGGEVLNRDRSIQLSDAPATVRPRLWERSKVTGLNPLELKTAGSDCRRHIPRQIK